MQIKMEKVNINLIKLFNRVPIAC